MGLYRLLADIVLLYPYALKKKSYFKIEST